MLFFYCYVFSSNNCTPNSHGSLSPRMVDYEQAVMHSMVDSLNGIVMNIYIPDKNEKNIMTTLFFIIIPCILVWISILA